MEEEPIVQMRGIWKRFGAVTALRDVDLDLYPNEVLGLVGDNAAGKSTLMKILSGAYIPDEGQLLVQGSPVHFKNTREAMDMGIEMVYQDFALCNNLNVVSNVFLGREIKQAILGPLLRRLNKKAMAEKTSEVINELGIGVKSVKAKVENLSGGQRQAVAISRAVGFEARVIIMDEPTASLSVKAIAPLLELITQLRTQGHAIILISHRLQDIFTVGDRVMVLKGGEKVGVRNLHETSMDDVVELMVKGFSSSEPGNEGDLARVYSAELSQGEE